MQMRTTIGALILSVSLLSGCASAPDATATQQVQATLVAPCHTVDEFDVTTYTDALVALSVLSDELAQCDARMALLRAQLDTR